MAPESGDRKWTKPHQQPGRPAIDGLSGTEVGLLLPRVIAIKAAGRDPNLQVVVSSPSQIESPG
jgi:hypothetical protein